MQKLLKQLGRLRGELLLLLFSEVRCAYRFLPKAKHIDPATGIGTNTRYNNEWFPGASDEVAVYDYALSADQVAAHYVAGTGQQ